MFCWSDQATKPIDLHASNWTDLGLNLSLSVSAPPGQSLPVPIWLCAPITFTTNAAALTRVRILVDGNPPDPACEGQIKLGSGEKLSFELSTCVQLSGGSHNITAQFKTDGTGNSCFFGTRTLMAMA